MKRICSWCVEEGKDGYMGEKPPLDDLRETHGACPMHKEKLLRDAGVVPEKGGSG